MNYVVTLNAVKGLIGCFTAFSVTMLFIISVLIDQPFDGLTNLVRSATIMPIILYGAYRNALELHSNNLENHARWTAGRRP